MSPGFGDEIIDLSCLVLICVYLPISYDYACIFQPSCACFKVSVHACMVFPRSVIGIEPRSRIMLFGNSE